MKIKANIECEMILKENIAEKIKEDIAIYGITSTESIYAEHISDCIWHAFQGEIDTEKSRITEKIKIEETKGVNKCF